MTDDQLDESGAAPIRCTCPAPPRRIAGDCPAHGLPALHAADRSTHGRPADLVIVDDPWPYDRGGIVPVGAGPKLEHPTGYVIPGPWLRPPTATIDRPRQAELKPAPMTEPARQLLDPFRRLAEAFVEIGRQLARAFGIGPLAGARARCWPHDMPPTRWRDWLPATERKADRARREHLDRQLRTLDRRAARRRRKRTRKAAPFYAIARAGRHGAAALDVLRTAAAGAR